MSRKPRPGAQARAKASIPASSREELASSREELAPFKEELAPSKEELAKAALSEERSVIKPEPAAEIDAAFNVEPLIRSKAAANMGSAADVFGAVTPEPVANVEPVVSAANVEPDVEFAPAAEAGPADSPDQVANPAEMKSDPDPEPEIDPEPAVVSPPVPPFPVVTQDMPVTHAEPAMEVVLENNDTAPEIVEQTMSTASDFGAASANVVSETIQATADTVAAVTSEVVETASSFKPTAPTATLGIRKMMKSTEDFVAFGQANLEAFVKSGQIWSAGMQELTKQFATSAKASFEESVSTFKAISTAKSVREAMDLQSSYAKATLEKAMAESNKLTDASIKLTEQTLAPITARMTVAVETFGKTA